MSDSVIYENVFEAIRSLEPNNPSLRALEGKKGGLIRRQNYEYMQMENGKYGIFLTGWNMTYYRGEPQLYPQCKPSLYRIPQGMKRMIARLRAIDFMLYLESRDDIRTEIKNGRYIDLPALAQHYGFATDILDLTEDLMTAAYFATHVFDEYRQDYAVVSEGIGRIRVTTEFAEPVGRLRMIGLQPLARPGLQSASGMVLAEEEDFALMSRSVRFYQDVKKNQLYHSTFLQGRDLYFPEEPDMRFVSKLLKDSDAVTSMAVNRYCQESEKDTCAVTKAVTDAGLYVVDAPLVCDHMPFYVPVRHQNQRPKSFRPILTIG